jgi:hypothetical protein
MNSLGMKFSHKDLILGMWVILSQKSVKSRVGNHVNDKYCKCCFEVCLIIYLCARRDYSKINLHSSKPPPRLEYLWLGN